MSDVLMRVVLQGSDQSLTSTVKSAMNVLSGSKGLGGVITGLTVGLVGVGLGLAKMAGDYNQSMMQLQNTTGSTDAQMKGYTSSIRQISDMTGVYQENLAKGMYEVISANFAGADATRILTTATKDAVETGADQTQVTTGLVVSLNAWNEKASQADTVSNQMFETLALGRGSMNDLAGALQTGGALVAHYGLNITDTDAMLATLSTGGMKTFGTSMTGITQLLNVMDGKTDLITKRIHKLGLSFDEAKFKTMSTVDQIAYLNKVMAKNQGQEVSVFGSKQAVSVLSILGTHSALLNTNIKKLGDTSSLAKQQTDAWTRTQGDFNFKLQDAETRAKNLGISAGLMLLPALSNLMDFIRNPLMPWMNNLIVGVENVAHWFGSAGPQGDILRYALVGIGLAIGTVKIVEMANNFMTFATKTIPETISKIGDLVGTSGMGKINAAAKSASDAETGIGITAKTTMASDVEAGSLAAEGSIAGIGTTATETEATVKTAAGGMGTAISGVLTGLLGILGIQEVMQNFQGLGDPNKQIQSGDKNPNDIASSLSNTGQPGFLTTWLSDFINTIKNGPNLFQGTQPYATPNTSPSQTSYQRTGGKHYALGGTVEPGEIGFVGDTGGRPEAIIGGTSGLTVLNPSQTQATFGSGKKKSGGHTFNFASGAIVINAPGGDPATISERFLDALEEKIAFRYRMQTGGHSEGGWA